MFKILRKHITYSYLLCRFGIIPMMLPWLVGRNFGIMEFCNRNCLENTLVKYHLTIVSERGILKI